MSRPLLNSSPTVDLRINTGRELEARVIPAAPNINNALRVRTDGLYVKRGIRTSPWVVQRLPPYGVTAPLANPTQANQALIWATEAVDTDGLVDLVTQPTRVTALESGYYWSRPFAYIAPVGASSAAAAAGTGQLLQLVNGTKWVAGNTVYAYAPIGATVVIEACCAAYVWLNAGDYIECFWRWILLELNTATSWLWQGQWSGGRISE